MVLSKYQHLKQVADENKPVLTPEEVDIAIESNARELNLINIELHYGNKNKSTLSHLALALEDGNTASTPSANSGNTASTPSAGNTPTTPKGDGNVKDQQDLKKKLKEQADQKKKQNKGLIRTIIDAIKRIFMKIKEVFKAIGGFFGKQKQQVEQIEQAVSTEEGQANIVVNNVVQQLQDAESEAEMEKVLEEVKPGLVQRVKQSFQDKGGIGEASKNGELHDGKLSNKKDEIYNRASNATASLLDKRDDVISWFRNIVKSEPKTVEGYGKMKLSKEQMKWFMFSRKYDGIGNELINYYTAMVADYNTYATALMDFFRDYKKVQSVAVDAYMTKRSVSGATSGDPKVNMSEVAMMEAFSSIIKPYVNMGTKYNGPVHPSKMNNTGNAQVLRTIDVAFDNEGGYKAIGPRLTQRKTFDNNFKNAAGQVFSMKNVSDWINSVREAVPKFENASKAAENMSANVANTISSITAETIEAEYRTKLNGKVEMSKVDDEVQTAVSVTLKFVQKLGSFVGWMINNYSELLKTICEVLDGQSSTLIGAQDDAVKVKEKEQNKLVAAAKGIKKAATKTGETLAAAGATPFS